MIRRPRSCRVVFDGQSRMAIPNWTGFLGYSWGRLVMAGRGLPAYLVAVSGQSITDLTADFATRVVPKISGPEPCIFVMGDVGPSDIIDEGDSAATVYSQAGAYANLARTAGADYVICCTMLPSVLFVGDQETRRVAANALIMEDGSGFFDAQVELNVPGLTDTSDIDAYYDGTHVYGYGQPYPFEDHGLGLGTARVAAVVDPFIDAAIDAVT